MLNLDYDTVEDLFSRCLEIDPSKQLEWLKTHCDENTALFNEVKSLLTAYDDSEDFLSQPIQFETLSDTQQKVFIKHIESKYLGKELGAYKIDRLLGRGGMGCVYLAHRNDGEYEQEVAIKVVESSTLETLQFKRERQILAQLNHPNIVTLLDGGTLPNGEGSYFVMEHVKGLTIDEHIKNKQLNTKQIIQLMIQLGLVIHEAHQHGIIHCDIKPANILVNEDGILKLLDFGISQLLNNPHQDGEPPAKRFALTPEYSSPRRHQQHPPVISDDIFSLGILLSHTISGKLPVVFEPDYMALPEPNIPKTALHIENKELQCIFLKAANPSEKKRYSSAKAFVDDLQNWLDKKVVNAVGHKLPYILKKHIRRNWRYWSLATVILLTLIITIIVWINKARVEQAKQQSQTTTEFMLADVDNALQNLPNATLLRKRIIQAALDRIKKQVEKSPDNTDIKKLEADMLNHLAEVTGHPYSLNENAKEEALLLYNQALDIYQTIDAERSDPVHSAENIADTQRRIAEIIAYQGNIKKGMEILSNARKSIEEVYTNAETPMQKRFPIVILYTVEAHGYLHMDNLPQAEELLSKAWKIIESTPPPSYIKYRLYIALLYEESGHLSLLKKDFKTAKEIYLKLIEKYKHKNLWQHKTRLARVHNGLACIALHENRTKEAQQHLQKLWKIYSNLRKKYPQAKNLETRIKLYQQTYNRFGNAQKINTNDFFTAMYCDNPTAFMLAPSKSK